MNRCIRDTISEWKDFTFEERWKLHSSAFDQGVSAAVARILFQPQYLNLREKAITGFTVEGLPRTEEHRTYPVRFAGAFHDVVNADNFDPVLYMLELTKRVYKIDQKVDDQKLTGFLARAFRSLTSFLKEPAFAADLHEFFEAKGIECHITMCQDEDAAHHTDVKVEVNGRVFRLWIYQCSDNGIPHDIDRVSGRRGKLPAGIHVLCPLHTSEAIQLGALESRYSQYEVKICEWRFLLSKIKNKDTKSYSNSLDKIQRNEQKAATLKIRIEEIYKNSGVDIINGFFLYPNGYVDDVAQKIINPNVVPEDYEVISTMMDAPRNYVSGINFFKV